MAAYGVDVLDPAVSTRRVHVLLERLPPSARRPGEAWSTEAELLAGLIDHVAYLTWVTLRAYGAKGAAKPRPVQRPRAAEHMRRPPARLDQARVPDGGQAKAGSWIDAALALGGIPGVQVVNRDG